MQFITNGPDIPDALLQAHEEGRVVFFCGAGISYPADLPGFKGLVDRIYKTTGTDPSSIEKAALDRGQYDAALNLLEERLPGMRQGLQMRKALASALIPKLRKPGALDTHIALLSLAKNRNQTLRLVTTNFDHLFVKAAKKLGQPITEHVASMLPIPKSSRWNGLVYLHGRLPSKSDENALHRLVITSGDFGLAYLTERWAARFVSELFRNYVVCFVGYSINDPVMRYMMDALAADRMLGEITPLAWAFADCGDGEEHQKTIEWKAKGVNPILYQVPAGAHDHSALHRTLKSWGETYRDGVNGKERLVVTHALARPGGSTTQDDFVGRMLWALSDKSGIPAQKFADFDPAPSIEWLMEAFADERYRHTDLVRFCVEANQEADDSLQFSLVHRPTPYLLASRMSLVSLGYFGSDWDHVMFQIARWLIRHLNDPSLVLWIAGRGGHIHEKFTWLIERQLDQIDQWERTGNSSELAQLQLNSPNGIPSSAMRVAWRLLMGNHLKGHRGTSDLFSWKRRLSRYGLTATLRLELRDCLRPRIVIRKPYRGANAEHASRFRDIFDWELSLTAEHAHSTLKDMKDLSKHLPSLLTDLQLLVHDALNLLQELGEADDQSDRSHWDLPSIEEHWQNRGFRDWVILIELLRDSWLSISKDDQKAAAAIADQWFQLPFPTFKRLALFAAGQGGVEASTWITWLSVDNAWWLWSIETRRETLSLLRKRHQDLDTEEHSDLEKLILIGPPRSMYSDDILDEDWHETIDRNVWLRLVKLQASGFKLSGHANERQTEISKRYPYWKIASDERDEFSHWMSGTGDPGFENETEFDKAPRKSKELSSWLQKFSAHRRPYYQDDWRETCGKHMLNCIRALRQLYADGVWISNRWAEALQAWSNPKHAKRSWKHAANSVAALTDAHLLDISHALSWWLKSVADAYSGRSTQVLDLCMRAVRLPIDESTGILVDQRPIEQPVTEAINHAVGIAVQAMLSLWLNEKISDGDLLPDEFSSAFHEICDTRVIRYRHGRVILCSHLISLFRADKDWTITHLLPLFDWNNGIAEAKAAWEGFLWSPRIYMPLFLAFKKQLLQTAEHYAQLGEHSSQYSIVLTYTALEKIDGFSFADFRVAFAVLPAEALAEAAQALSQALESVSNQKEDYWKNRIKPFWAEVWPKSQTLVSASIADKLARMAIAAGREFPDAIATVIHWLVPIEHADYHVHLLHDAKLCGSFPEASLQLLNAIVKADQWIPTNLPDCLAEIVASDPSLESNARFQKLSLFAKRFG